MSSHFSTQDQDSKSDNKTDSFINTSSIYQRPTAIELAGGNEEPKKNLWYHLLNSVGLRKDLQQAHLLVLGDRGAGKRSLVKQMNKPFLKGIFNGA